jgi:16S rRNA (guanine527-N7)-methyltransferase
MTSPQNLRSGLAQLNLKLRTHAQQQLLHFVDLLVKWNQTYNLTAITEPGDIITHHLLDSLVLLPYLVAQKRILDLGTGAGLPEKKFVLLDSRSKKTIFLQHVVLALDLRNVEIIQSRATDYQSSCFDMVLSRAVGTLSYVVEQTQHLICKSGSWLMMKGKLPEQEFCDLKHTYEIQPLNVPGLKSERHLVIVRNDRA